jgi:hypothetical protein
MVNILDGDDSPWPNERDHLGERALGVRLLEQYQPLMHEVEGCSGKARRCGLRLHQAHVGYMPFREHTLGHRDEVRLALEPDDLSCGTNACGQEVENAERAATDVDDMPTRLYADCIEEPARLFFEGLTLL